MQLVILLASYYLYLVMLELKHCSGIYCVPLRVKSRYRFVRGLLFIQSLNMLFVQSLFCSLILQYAFIFSSSIFSSFYVSAIQISSKSSIICNFILRGFDIHFLFLLCYLSIQIYFITSCSSYADISYSFFLFPIRIYCSVSSFPLLFHLLFILSCFSVISSYYVYLSVYDMVFYVISLYRCQFNSSSYNLLISYLIVLFSISFVLLFPFIWTSILPK